MNYRWVPAILLGTGVFLTLGAAKQRTLPLERSLAEVIPAEIAGFVGQDLAIPDAEAEVAGFSNYLFRVYERPLADTAGNMESAEEVDDPTPPWFSLYVGYYESQTRGKTIHSPKNCLPGAGWEAVSSEPLDLHLDGRTVRVNRFLLQNGTERSLALYWYQGRGRVEHDEYMVKFHLLRDAALRRRSDEALVRIVVPLQGSMEAALDLAGEAAKLVIPRLDDALPST